jgi:hypothetical protein
VILRAHDGRGERNRHDLVTNETQSSNVEYRYRFLTFNNYVEASALLTRDIAAAQYDAFYPVISSTRFSKIARRSSVDLASIERRLRTAWTRHYALDQVLKQDPGALVAEAPRIAYYTAYTMVGAFIESSGQTVPNTHAATLNLAVNQIRLSRKLLPTPLNVLMSGNPEAGSLLLNLPTGARIHPISHIDPCTPESAWGIYALMLKTTRRKQIEYEAQEWKASNKKARVPGGFRQRASDKLQPTSIFHCLLRLRLRFDYDESETFLIGMGSQGEAAAFVVNLSSTLDAVLCALEILIARYIGNDNFARIVDDFLPPGHRSDIPTAPAERWSRLSQLSY